MMTNRQLDNDELKLEDISPEILLHIVNYLDNQSQSRMACTGRLFRSISNDKSTDWSILKATHLAERRNKANELKAQHGGGWDLAGPEHIFVGKTNQGIEICWMLAMAASLNVGIFGALAPTLGLADYGILARVSLFAVGAVSAGLCHKKVNDFRDKYFNSI